MKTLQRHIEEAKALGLIPYVATSESYVPFLDMALLGEGTLVKLMERPEDKVFHQAYVFANFLGFGGTGVEMPGWVYLDCVLMQTAVIGFAIHKERLPSAITDKFKAHPDIDFEALEYVPITGQTAGLGIDGQTLVGFSLFSLRRYFANRDWPALGLLTKAMGLGAQQAQKKEKFIGIAQYDNPALKIHGRFAPSMYIQTPMVPLHPLSDMTMIYAMKVDLDMPHLFDETPPAPDAAYEFLLRSDDYAAKAEMAANISAGQKYIILPPFQIKKEGAIYLPVKTEKP